MSNANIFDGDLVEVVFRHMSSIGQPLVCVRHWYCSGDGIEGVPADYLAVVFEYLWGVHVLPAVSAACSLEVVEVWRVLPSPAGPLGAVYASSSGGIQGDPLPPQVSLCLSLKVTPLSGFRPGSLFLPQPGVDSSDERGAPTAEYLSLVSGAAPLFLDPQEVDGDDGLYYFWPSVFSRVRQDHTGVVDVRIPTFWTVNRRRSGFRVLPPPPP